MWLLTLWFWLGNQALPDYLWAFGRQTERPTRVAHRAGRAFVASDARPTPWTTLHCLQRLPWHSESRCDNGKPVLGPPRRGSHREERATQASRTRAAPTNSPDEAFFSGGPRSRTSRNLPSMHLHAPASIGICAQGVSPALG